MENKFNTCNKENDPEIVYICININNLTSQLCQSQLEKSVP